MHPILFRIPLPNRPIQIWWICLVVALLALPFALLALRNKRKDEAWFPGLVAVAAIGAAVAFRGSEPFQRHDLPIYSYGVMLGLSLVVGWYLTLGLSKRIGLPEEIMANCYVVTAVSALVGARLLYVVTNPEEFTKAGTFSMKLLMMPEAGCGGLVAYGGFLGGFIGSWAYLRAQGIKLMPWTDVAIPSLAAGLFITRIGCYLFGCDFGKRLPDTAPAFLKKLGTFPEGSPAYKLFRGQGGSLPVHPTQIYESLAGLLLLILVLRRRKQQTFRGEIFLLFVFFYGVARFAIEILRGDPERNEYGPLLGEHLLLPGCFLLFAIGFTFAYARDIKNKGLRYGLLAVAFAIPVLLYVKMAPASFEAPRSIQLSTSQIIALFTALLATWFHRIFAERAEVQPRQAMDLGLPKALSPKKKKKAKPILGAGAVGTAAVTTPTTEADAASEDVSDEDEDEDADSDEVAETAAEVVEPKPEAKADDVKKPGNDSGSAPVEG